MDTSIPLEQQLLATKFYVPIPSSSLIPRPRLQTLLNQSLERPLTLVSAPAGFGKTALLADWTQSLPVNQPLVAWLSLDEEDNDPRLFWTYILTALQKQQPELFSPMVAQLQAPQAPPLQYLLAALINLLVESTNHFLLILDDYQLITEPQVHSTLSYLIEHSPPQLHLIISSRADPPLSLPQMRIRRQMLEVRTDRLRCTVEETKAFFHKIMDLQLPDETIQQITARMEGWLVGLHLLGLSLPEQAHPLTAIKLATGDQHYILDYLTQEVLGRQPQEVQEFLLSTCILERFNASLCDALTQQTSSQQMLQRLEQANLFVVSLDSKRQWYRYHALFAQALSHHLQQLHPSHVPTLHSRASHWYAEHNQATEAIVHALHAKEWSWAADLIQQKLLPLLSHNWGASKHVLISIKEWLELLPIEVMHARPPLCLASALLLFQVASYPLLEGWLDVAEATLTTALTTQMDEDSSFDMSIQETLLAAVIGLRAVLRKYEEDGPTALKLFQQALTLIPSDNLTFRAQNILCQAIVYFSTSVNDAVAAIETGLQAISLAQETGQSGLIILVTASMTLHMIGIGQLHEAYRLTQQAIELGKSSAELMLPKLGLATTVQALVLCEWNKLDAASALAQEALSLSQQEESYLSLTYIAHEYATLLHIALARGDLNVAQRAFQEFESIGTQLNRNLYLEVCSEIFIIDQVRFWLACGDVDQATAWGEALNRTERHTNPFFCERQEVACARILLATDQSALALQRLEPVLQRATAGKRWGHVIEIRLLQALAYQMHHQETQALDTLSEAVRLAEPEGYIRSFVDEGAPMEILLYHLRKRERVHGPTPYLDRVITAFQQESTTYAYKDKGHSKGQALPEPLSQRELQVLRSLARGASNQEIAHELVIAIDTVKRHISHIFAKLGVQNRVQAVKQARQLGLLDVEE